MKKPTLKRKPKLPRVPIPKPTQVIPNKKKDDKLSFKGKPFEWDDDL